MTEPARWASDSLVPPRGAAWDLLVVGGGTAGLVAAKAAAGFGATVLLVERDRTGGDCLWTGCVPSKTLLAAAHAAAEARAAGRHGIHIAGLTVDFGQVMQRVHEAIADIEPDDSPATLRAAGVRVAQGEVIFTGPTTIAVDGGPVSFRRALLATGAAPVVPPIPGLAAATPLTSETVWSLTELPGRLLVLGGGSIGCELGQAFCRLGSTVSIVESLPTLLSREDPEAATLVSAALKADGVTVRTGVALVGVSPADRGWTAELADGSSIDFDQILVAVGRRARTAGIGLESAGVQLDQRGLVQVDERLQTTNPRVWAAGDLTAYPPFTHTAGVHGTTAATNAVLGLRRTVDANTVPRVTFTQPEVAAVGASAADAHDHRGWVVRTVRHDSVDRAIAEGVTAGFTRLVLDDRGRVAGATIVGPRAGESLAEVVLALTNGLRATDLSSAMHAYPTYGDGVWKAAISQVQARLRTPPLRTAIRLLAAWRRRFG